MPKDIMRREHNYLSVYGMGSEEEIGFQSASTFLSGSKRVLV